jgi:chromosome transmission fidelity protein 18
MSIFSPVEQFLQYELSSPKAILPKQYAVRRMIAHEVKKKKKKKE